MTYTLIAKRKLLVRGNLICVDFCVDFLEKFRIGNKDMLKFLDWLITVYRQSYICLSRKTYLENSMFSLCKAFQGLCEDKV